MSRQNNPLFRRSFMALSVGLFFTSAINPLQAQTGQTIVINEDLGEEHWVAGNGDINNKGFWDIDEPKDLKDPSGNRVTINSNGVVDGWVAGGVAHQEDGSSVTSQGNTVTINGGKIWDSDEMIRGVVFGGIAISEEGKAAAAGNNVIVSSGSKMDVAYGGASTSSADDSGGAASTGNSVSIHNASVYHEVAGGTASSVSGSVETRDNRVVIGGSSSVEGDVYGGKSYNVSFSMNGTTTGWIELEDFYNWHDEAGINTSSTSETDFIVSTGNSVAISGTTDVIGRVVGGHATSGDDASLTVTYNSVGISGNVTVGEHVIGGFAMSEGDAPFIIADDNFVTISGGTIEGTVIGGYALGESSGTATISANNNRVLISGGHVLDNIAGGIAWDESSTAAVTATDNVVTITGDAAFASNIELYGGDGKGGFPTDFFTGNTLNIWNYTGASSVALVKNFQFYNFALPANATSASGPMLETASVDFTNPGAGDNSRIASVGFMGGGRLQQAGETFTLMSGDFEGTIANNGGTVQGKKGATLIYDEIQIDQSGTALTATIGQGPRASPQAKALSEGILSGVALINQGADLVSWRGIPMAATAAKGEDGKGAFGAVSGGRSRYNTGSHIKMNSVSLLAGVAWGKNLDGDSHLTFGGFVEYGNGSYDTYNSFANATSIDGDGRAYYFGLGALGRLDMANSFYTEGSFRLGHVRNRDNTTLTDAADNRANYKSSSMYFSAHLGAGHVVNITDKNSLDLYGKYFWSHQGSDSVTLSTGDPVNFRSADSHRTRLGMRFGQDIGDGVLLYAGAAYEYEFSGKAKATTYGYSMDAPSLKGSTGIGELGVTFQPSDKRPLFVDLGVQGYVGKREGITGSLRLKYQF